MRTRTFYGQITSTDGAFDIRILDELRATNPGCIAYSFIQDTDFIYIIRFIVYYANFRSLYSLRCLLRESAWTIFESTKSFAQQLEHHEGLFGRYLIEGEIPNQGRRNDLGYCRPR